MHEQETKFYEYRGFNGTYEQLNELAAEGWRIIQCDTWMPNGGTPLGCTAILEREVP